MWHPPSADLGCEITGGIRRRRMPHSFGITFHNSTPGSMSSINRRACGLKNFPLRMTTP